ncbi:MutS domain protein, family 4 [Candidatus Syntrophocurvum alkaliphilum]|uniref:MutS domain protein, family 4 n=1 Tax=Candidatus Syntrophocurvum alkaliphilum TaxID=2293317 RepID=A0A6I6DLZ5_9FIRM|nr:DNA mismatch repair protein MutS [Candidatus Syntrophocurvum alkaliphilum]QGU00132.1 MutS domain protein, family 4 [Candidatus Syntrophocurvum alkaliphilum]
MKAYLMFCDRDFDIKTELCFGKETLTADLELKHILANMAQDDKAIHDACEAALFRPLQSTEEIEYRQKNLYDALQNPDTVRQLYEITVKTENKRRSSLYWLSSANLSSTFSSAIELLKIYTEMLMELRLVADSKLSSFQSYGFRNLLTMLQRELDDDYFAEVRAHLNNLKDDKGTLISATLGNYLQGVGYVLRQNNRKGFWRRWFFAPSFTIAERDHAGVTDLGKRRDRAINEVTNALAQAAEHLESFFAMLRSELAFYVGCLNLADSLQTLGMPICIPSLLPSDSKDRYCRRLYDVSLALTKNTVVVGNELDTTAKQLYLITGANQGGKTTFLRSLGQAQLMAQSGMFVGADDFFAPIRRGVFSHFKKEEDNAMKSGKLDEELARMSEIADHLEEGALMLFNESFASSNEREGSEICRQITQALVENGVEVFSVTHLYTYATAFLGDKNTQYLRAQRLENGERNFKLVPGEPLQTAFGEDLYQKFFGQSEVSERDR